MSISDQVVAELETLIGGTDLLRPEDVLAKAQADPTCALHHEFARRTSWDVAKAARERWLEVASEIIRDYKVVVHTQQRTIRVKAMAYAPEERAYRTTASIKQENDVQAMVREMRQCSHTVIQNLRRLIGLAEFWELPHDDARDAATAIREFDEMVGTITAENWPKISKRKGRDDNAGDDDHPTP